MRDVNELFEQLARLFSDKKEQEKLRSSQGTKYFGKSVKKGGKMGNRRSQF